jgi:PKD repeat protein
MKAGKSHVLKIAAVLWLLFAAVSLFAQGNSEGKAKPAFPSIQIGRHVRGEEGIRALGGKLPEVAAWYRKTTDELAKLLRRDRTLWVSPTGRLMYACELEAPLEAETVAATGSTRALTATASFLPDQTFKLHSLPGSNRIIYLDFNGATVSGTAWNANYNGGYDIIAAPFSLDSDSSTFSTTELQHIQNIWKRVAEDYAPFDVDVTTEEPAATLLARTSSSDFQYGNRVIITPTNFYPNAGGVSYVGSFDDVGEYYKTSWAFSNMLANGEKYIAEACSHEGGHAVGLSHEGTTSGVEYYQGQGDWAPIMGNSYYKNVTQWAKGEYIGANNKEDQLQVMQSYGLAYYADDHGNTADASTLLTPGSTLSGSGFIERNTDVDAFKFIAGSGSVALSVSSAPLGPNLKLLAELRDANGILISSSSLSDIGSVINTSVYAGTYYLMVSGIGSGDPASSGYSNYASLGQYIIAGTVADPGNLLPPTAVASASATTGEIPLTVYFIGSGSTDDVGIVSYSWNFGDGSEASTSVNPSHVYNAVGSYKAVLTVKDEDGLTGSAWVNITVNPVQIIDVTPPTISITSPKPGSVVRNTVSVQVSASDNVGVKKVELFVDGKMTATATTAPFTTKWNASKASKGQHTLQTKVYDAAGNVGLVSITVIK